MLTSRQKLWFGGIPIVTGYLLNSLFHTFSLCLLTFGICFVFTSILYEHAFRKFLNENRNKHNVARQYEEAVNNARKYKEQEV